MIKVLFISQYLNRGGTETFMMNVFRGVDSAQFQVDFLLYSWKETDYSRAVEEAGGCVYRVPCRKQNPLKWHLSLNQFFREHSKEYNAIHFCGNSLTSIAPIYYAYKYGIPVRIVHAHSSSARGWHNRMLHLLKRSYAYRISTHHFACSTMAAQWFFRKKEATIISNGIDVKAYSFDVRKREQIRKALSIEVNEVVIGHVGRFTSEKNHVFIIEIFAKFVKQNPNSKLMLVGAGPLLDEIRQKAILLGVEERVLLLGERSDVACLMQAMDIFLMPSLFEGLPFVLIEAQAAGLPCLVSDTINKDICITDNVDFTSLRATPNEWAEMLEAKCSGFVRTDCSESIVKKGYSIEDTILLLQKIYANQLCR